MWALVCLWACLWAPPAGAVPQRDGYYYPDARASRGAAEAEPRAPPLGPVLVGGGYEGVLVRIAEDVPEAWCEDVLLGLEVRRGDDFTLTSSIIY